MSQTDSPLLVLSLECDIYTDIYTDTPSGLSFDGLSPSLKVKATTGITRRHKGYFKIIAG